MKDLKDLTREDSEEDEALLESKRRRSPTLPPPVHGTGRVSLSQLAMSQIIPIHYEYLYFVDFCLAKFFFHRHDFDPSWSAGWRVLEVSLYLDDYRIVWVDTRCFLFVLSPVTARTLSMIA